MGIQVPIIFTSNVNQKTRTRQSHSQPFGMEMERAHSSAAILAADETGSLGLVKIRRLCEEKLKPRELQTGLPVMSRERWEKEYAFCSRL